MCRNTHHRWTGSDSRFSVLHSYSWTLRGWQHSDCVVTALEARCITTLPDACASLSSSNGLALVGNIAGCTVALGPFALGSAATCLSTGSITSSTTGASVVECLEIAFGIRSGTVTITDPALCATPTPTPVVPVCAEVPAPCQDLGNVNGLALVAAIPLCTSALGVFAVGNVATCLGTDLISQNTLGTTVVGCLEDALQSTCISELPGPCQDLQDNTVVELAINLPLCTAALGPFAVGNTLTCLTSGLGNGNSVIECLNASLFGGGGAAAAVRF
ncbi:hypothetical protein VD0002_g1098 [Verticillium dahliae]|uniref:Uncharacterized protein n=1 Tax=Verticillium dahliae TaxID=27337 RepID=A0AA44WHJ8_VERDA|nr:hypothetical protein BJF96_g5737 [Verticillium dahliae]PNH55286.1 hypothetical protein VD0003_g2275 [Verticillium dahliae]PNH69214.1 hypothetical protein VD0002_g1098 [Verticillium dahliae]